MLDPLLTANPWLLGLAVVFDLVFGDPIYRLHPIRLIGSALQWFEGGLRRIGLDGYLGGILLFVALATLFGGAAAAIAMAMPNEWARGIFHVYVLFSMVAMGDLLKHASAVDRAATKGADPARVAIAQLVGRDTSRMSAGDCRRAAMESLAESLVDGFMSPVFWYLLLGLPGIVVFKVVSTMDSMVGYKTEKYLKFGWCGARLDDLLNFVPARLSWILLGLVALVLPGASASKAWRIGLAQHHHVPGPNAGWSEATAAGALQRKLVGPIWRSGQLVTEIWLGDPNDQPAESSADLRRAVALVVTAGIAFVSLVVAGLAGRW